MTTWSVFERTMFLGRSQTTVIEKQVAICGTMDQALDEVRRLSRDNCPDSWCPQRGASDSECPTYYIKSTAVTIGLTLVPP